MRSSSCVKCSPFINLWEKKFETSGEVRGWKEFEKSGVEVIVKKVQVGRSTWWRQSFKRESWGCISHIGVCFELILSGFL